MKPCVASMENTLKGIMCSSSILINKVHFLNESCDLIATSHRYESGHIFMYIMLNVL